MSAGIYLVCESGGSQTAATVTRREIPSSYARNLEGQHQLWLG
jgi:hypothetical protein